MSQFLKPLSARLRDPSPTCRHVMSAHLSTSRKQDPPSVVKIVLEQKSCIVLQCLNEVFRKISDFNGRAWPEMLALWNSLLGKALSQSLDKDEKRFFEKWFMSLELLCSNPGHPGLQSHEIEDLSRKYGVKVWQSYLENRTSGARRMFWAYGPDKGQITILGVESHPNTSKKTAYKRIKLNSFPGR